MTAAIEHRRYARPFQWIDAARRVAMDDVIPFGSDPHAASAVGKEPADVVARQPLLRGEMTEVAAVEDEDATSRGGDADAARVIENDLDQASFRKSGLGAPDLELRAVEVNQF